MSSVKKVMKFPLWMFLSKTGQEIMFDDLFFRKQTLLDYKKAI